MVAACGRESDGREVDSRKTSDKEVDGRETSGRDCGKETGGMGPVIGKLMAGCFDIREIRGRHTRGKGADGSVGN